MTIYCMEIQYQCLWFLVIQCLCIPSNHEKKGGARNGRFHRKMDWCSNRICTTTFLTKCVETDWRMFGINELNVEHLKLPI